ncbi:hypothetical protein VNI00_015256 [Paramarasmius palmivorus]|uniref:Uncharacterized protein n=1 Tax=Paramarasmius palmivorus TaxID=297713 RepID=A0AAW0BNG3_9AGAR
MRTTCFPKLRSMEVPYFFVLDPVTTIRLHSRLRNCVSELHIFNRDGGRIRRLTLLTMVDGWPALKRLCVRCKWGLPPFDGPLFDFTHLNTVTELSVLLVDRPWAANVAFFLAHMHPPPNVDVIALLLCNRQFVRHSLFTDHLFHPKMVVPVFGDPSQAVYRGEAHLEYICNLVCVVDERPTQEGFWVKLKESIGRRTLLPHLFHSDCKDLIKLK